MTGHAPRKPAGASEARRVAEAVRGAQARRRRWRRKRRERTGTESRHHLVETHVE